MYPRVNLASIQIIQKYNIEHFSTSKFLEYYFDGNTALLLLRILNTQI